VNGHKEIIAARMAGKAPVAVTFFVMPGKPDRLGHVHVTEAEALERKLDLRFVFDLPVCVNGYGANLKAGQYLHSHLTKFAPSRCLYVAPNCLLEWQGESGEIEWAP
jgi:hypothetical protein